MIYKWEPSDQQDSIVIFWLKSKTEKSYSGLAIEFNYDGKIGMVYDEVLYDNDDLDEGESWRDYNEFGDDKSFIKMIFNPPTWNM